MRYGKKARREASGQGRAHVGSLLMRGHVRSARHSRRHGRERQGCRVAREAGSGQHTGTAARCWPARRILHLTPDRDMTHTRQAGSRAQHMHACQEWCSAVHVREEGRGCRGEREAGERRTGERPGMRDIPMSRLTYSRTEYTHIHTHECEGCGERGEKK